MDLISGILVVYGLIMIIFATNRLLTPWMKSDGRDKGRIVVGIGAISVASIIMLFC